MVTVEWLIRAWQTSSSIFFGILMTAQIMPAFTLIYKDFVPGFVAEVCCVSQSCELKQPLQHSLMFMLHLLQSSTQRFVHAKKK